MIQWWSFFNEIDLDPSVCHSHSPQCTTCAWIGWLLTWSNLVEVMWLQYRKKNNIVPSHSLALHPLTHINCLLSVVERKWTNVIWVLL